MESHELLQSFDATVWAKEFCAVAAGHGHPGIDEGWMVSWFANALMRGYDEYRWKVNTPEIANFVHGVTIEAAHQRERWGEAHDREKSAEHWYWLVGYLAGKASRSHIEGDLDKARHHTISSAAALFHWHSAISKDVSGHGVGRDADLQAHNDGRQAHETRPIR